MISAKSGNVWISIESVNHRFMGVASFDLSPNIEEHIFARAGSSEEEDTFIKLNEALLDLSKKLEILVSNGLTESVFPDVAELLELNLFFEECSSLCKKQILGLPKNINKALASLKKKMF